MASKTMMFLSLVLAACSALGTSDSHELQLADDPKSSNAVEMVLKMMQDLDAKVVVEGEEEEKTYGKFSTWCDDTKKEKAEDIQNGEDQKALHETNIKNAKQERDDFKVLSGELAKDISDLKENIAEADRARVAAAALYKKTNSDLEHAVRAAGQAADAIKASNDRSSFLQMDEQVKAVRESALLAESAGFSSQESLDALSNEQSDLADPNDWKTPILDMLEKLEGTFRSDDEKGDMEEQKAITEYKLLRQKRLMSIDDKKRSLAKAEADTAARVKKIAQTKDDLENTKAALADDTTFLAETEQTCLEKKVTFEQRKATRDEEREALKLAIKTMQDVTSGNFTEGNVGLLEVATRAATDPTILGSAEAEAEAIEEETGVFSAPLAFFQGIMHRHRHMRRVHAHQRERRHHLRSQRAEETPPAMSAIQTAAHQPSLTKQQQALLQFLTKKAASTKSSKLVLLARRVATGSDPFAAVKELIVGLITKLRAEAEASQTKKMSCDKKISESTVRRDEAAKKVKELNGDMEEATARKDRLTVELAELAEKLKKMGSEENQTTELRNQEKAENEQSIADAKTGLSGVRQAMQILKDFYGKAKKNEVAKVNATEDKEKSLLSVEPAPDAGFKNGEANKGSQAASTGIVGMLETIESDFKRTIQDTQAGEEKAATDYKKFVAEMEASTAAKKKAQDIKNNQLDAVTKDLSDDDIALETEIKALQVAVQELKAHDAECGHGVTFEQRKAARKAEMDALEEAIAFFESV